MRSDLIPLSAAALVTGVMALVLGSLLNPSGNEASVSGQLYIAAQDSNLWLAMSLLFFGGAAALVLGLPAVTSLFEQRRGRGLGLFGAAVFAVGCVGVGGLSALMLMFRSLALEIATSAAPEVGELAVVRAALEETALRWSLQVWVFGFLAGVLFIGLGLLRARTVPRWVPALLFAFLAMQLLLPVMGEGSTMSQVTSSVSLVLLAGGFTGIATNATSNRAAVPLTHTLNAPPAR